MAFISKRPPPKRTPVLAEMFEEEDFEFGDEDDKAKAFADKRLQEYRDAPFKLKLARRYLWRQAFINAWYGNVDVKEIPTEDLRIISDHTGEDYATTKYAQKIKSPVTAVRAFCVNCQGGSISFVRNCTNSICPLFPFRMGSNPFYGRIADADAEVSEEFPEEEETTDGNIEA